MLTGGDISHPALTEVFRSPHWEQTHYARLGVVEQEENEDNLGARLHLWNWRHSYRYRMPRLSIIPRLSLLTF